MAENGVNLNNHKFCVEDCCPCLLSYLTLTLQYMWLVFIPEFLTPFQVLLLSDVMCCHEVSVNYRTVSIMILKFLLL